MNQTTQQDHPQETDKTRANNVKMSTKRCVYALSLIKLEHKGVILMTPKQASELGKLLRQGRERRGISTYGLAKQVGTIQSTIVRLEQGQFGAPRPDKLDRIAKALDLDRVEVFARAGYIMADELPSLEPYLAIKYPDLSERAISALMRQFEGLPIGSTPTSAGSQEGAIYDISAA
jgi:transcriptional regulator with XRE-family HTH domain